MNVFISYSLMDREFVDRLAKHLESAGMRAFFASRDINAGDSIPGEINKALETCDRFVLVLSPNSVQSRWVQLEIDAIITMELREERSLLIPVLVAHCNIPRIIAAKKYANFTASFEAGMAEMLHALGVEKAEGDVHAMGLLPESAPHAMPLRSASLIESCPRCASPEYRLRIVLEAGATEVRICNVCGEEYQFFPYGCY